jgi:undecaprenyl-diphosphatase
VVNERKIALLLSVAAFVLLSAAAGAGLLHSFDLWALRTAQSYASGSLDDAGGLFSLLGGAGLTGMALAALLVVLLAQGRRELAGRLLVAFVVTGLLELAMKFLLPQSPIPDGAARLTGSYDPLLEVHTPHPYPSGHMLRSVILLGAVFALWRNAPARVAISVLLAGMAFTRVYLGVHWATDVIGGALLGIAGLAWAFKRRKGRAWRSR